MHEEHGCLTGPMLRLTSPERMTKNLKKDLTALLKAYKEKHCLASNSLEISSANRDSRVKNSLELTLSELSDNITATHRTSFGKMEKLLNFDFLTETCRESYKKQRGGVSLNKNVNKSE